MARLQSATDTASAPAFDYADYALAISGAALFSTKGIFIKLAYGIGADAGTVLALRMLVALPFYIAIGGWLLSRDRTLRALLTPRVLVGSALVGILGYYVASLIDFTGLAFISAQYERLVLFTYPFFTLALGVMFFGDRMVWRVVPGLVVSYAGLMVIFGWNLAVNPHGLVEGTSLVLAAALAFALYQHLARRQMDVIGSRVFTVIGMTSAGIVALAQNAVQHGIGAFGHVTPQLWGYGLALGLLGTVVPSFLLNGAIARIGARATSSTGTWGPVMTIILAVTILGEPFTVYHAVGTVMVIGGSVLFARANQRAGATAK